MSDLLLSLKLIEKEAKFYHAINYSDFGEYCKNGAILSRQLLSTSYPKFTKFFSDRIDIEKGVWGRTFGNLNDIGRYFWSFENSTPNAYGPITIVLRKESWRALRDIAITKRTITSVKNEKITHENVENIFEEFNGHFRLKSGYTGTEVSSSNSKIEFDNIAYLLIDPMIINGQSLKQHVSNLIKDTGLLNNGITANQIKERSVYNEKQKDRISELIEWSQILKGRLIDKNESLENTLPENLNDWFHNIDDWKKGILASWLTYIYNGTISHLE